MCFHVQFQLKEMYFKRPNSELVVLSCLTLIASEVKKGAMPSVYILRFAYTSYCQLSDLHVLLNSVSRAWLEPII